MYLILLIFIAGGGIIGILFDIFRIRRIIIKLPDFVTYIEDVLFWIITGIILIFLIFYLNNDDIRLYHFLLFLLGMSVYFIFISKYILKMFVKIKCKKNK